MRFTTFAAVSACVLVVAGCGSSGSSSSSSGTLTSSDKVTEAKYTQVNRLAAALKKDPNNCAAQENLANAYVAAASPESGQTKLPAHSDSFNASALKLLEQAHQCKASDPSISQNLVDAYLHAHQYTQAEALLEGLVTQKGATANTYYQLALAAQNAGHFQTAINAWQQFIAKSPKSEPRIPSVRQFIQGDKAALKQQKSGIPDNTSTTSVSTTSTSSTKK